MNELECGWTRRALDRSFDGDPLGAADQARLEAHLERCASCRGLRAELDEVRRRLRSMAPQRLPDEALDAVWARTIHAPRSTPWRALAAAAVVVVALGGLVWLDVPDPGGPSDSELRRAAEESRMVLGLTAQAMRRTEQVVLHEVLSQDVSGALRRVPVDWPAADGVAGPTDRSER